VIDCLRADFERSVPGLCTGAHRCCRTLGFNIRNEGDTFVTLTSVSAPRCRARRPDIEPSGPPSPNQDSSPGWYMLQALQSRGRSPLGAQLGPVMIPERTLVSRCGRTEESSNLCCRTETETERRPSATGQLREPAGHSDKAGGREALPTKGADVARLDCGCFRLQLAGGDGLECPSHQPNGIDCFQVRTRNRLT